MSHLRRARLGPRPTSGHERARRLAAEHLHDALGPEQLAWLADHLADCPACTAAAADYEAQRSALRALRFAEPPRDLWARTSAALDLEERRAAARAGRARTALEGRRLVPYGALAGALVVAVVVGTSLLSGGGSVQPIGSAAPSVVASVAAAPTPVVLSAAPVAWLTPAEDGTYALNISPVDRVCPPEGAPDCAPLDESARATIRLSAAPRSVVRSPTGGSVVVVDAATVGAAGGTVYVVGFPASMPAASTPGPSVAPIAIGTAAPKTPAPETSAVASPSVPSAEASASAESSAVPSVEPTAPVEGSAAPSEPPAPPSDASALPGPSESAVPSASTSGDVTPIATGVIVVGETAAYSPDGQWFAFTARPADGSRGPDIFVWHVGDAAARPVTDDGASVFSSWLGDLALGSRAVQDATGGTSAPPTVDGVPPGGTEPVGPTSPDVSPGPQTTTPAQSQTPTAAPTLAPPAPTASPAAPSGGATAGPDTSPGLSTGVPSTPVGPTATPASFLLDPATGGRADLAGAAWRPVADPSGRYVVYWSGTLAIDPSTGEWGPLDGTLLIAPWSWLVSGASAPSTPGDDLLLPGGSPSPTPESSAPGESGTPTAEASAAIGADVTPSPAPTVDAGSSTGPAPSTSPLAPLTSPEPLLGPDAAGLAVGTFQEWDVRWDPTGARLALWIGDGLDPRLGRLSLLTVDQSTGRVDGERSLLRDAPALAGYSIAVGRLAWATPSGQDGEGSRLLVLGWTTDGVGSLDGQPVLGPEEVIVVR